MSLIQIQTIKQASTLLCISVIIGYVVNVFHPNSVKISSERPPLEFAADTTFTHALEDVSISGSDSQLDVTPPIINIKLLKSLIDDDSAVLLDARSPTAYQVETLPKALNLPIEDLFEYEQLIEQLPRDKWLVCFCSDMMCDLAEHLSNELKGMGFEHISYFKGGVREWKQAGYKTESGGKHD